MAKGIGVKGVTASHIRSKAPFYKPYCSIIKAMTALTITPAQRKSLKADAHDLSPVVMIGGDGLTPAVIKEAKLAISHHGLIKVRVFGDEREARIAIYEELCDKLGAAPVQHIGKLLVLWKPKDIVDDCLLYTSPSPRDRG